MAVKNLWRELLEKSDDVEDDQVGGNLFTAAMRNAEKNNEINQFWASVTEGWSKVQLIDLQIAVLEMMKEDYLNGS